MLSSGRINTILPDTWAAGRVQHRQNIHKIRFDQVVNGKWETACQSATHFSNHALIQPGIVRETRQLITQFMDKGARQSRPNQCVKLRSFSHVQFRKRTENDLHFKRASKSFSTSSHARPKGCEPDAAAMRRSSSSLCQSGICGETSTLCSTLSHKASINAIRSSTGRRRISLIWAVVMETM